MARKNVNIFKCSSLGKVANVSVVVLGGDLRLIVFYVVQGIMKFMIDGVEDLNYEVFMSMGCCKSCPETTSIDVKSNLLNQNFGK